MDCQKMGGRLSVKEKKLKEQLDHTRKRIRIVMDRAKSWRNHQADQGLPSAPGKAILVADNEPETQDTE